MKEVYSDLVIFHVCGNRDHPFHAMTQYSMKLCQALRNIGLTSWVLSNMKHSQVPTHWKALLLPPINWDTTTDSGLDRIIETQTQGSRRLPIIHLSLSFPNHGCVVTPDFLAHYSTVITVHEHSTKPRSDQVAQMAYFEAASKIITSSYREHRAVSGLSEKLKRNTHVVLRDQPLDLTFPIPPTIVPPGEARRNPFARDIAWLGMIRSGYDWRPLLEIAKELETKCPDSRLHIIGTAVNPIQYIRLLETIYGVSLFSYGHDLERPGSIDRDFIGIKMRSLPTLLKTLHERGCPNVLLHIDKTDREISSILLKHCTLGIQHNSSLHIDHSSSIPSLMAHGLPVIVRDSTHLGNDVCSSSLARSALLVVDSQPPEQFVYGAVDWIRKFTDHPNQARVISEQVATYLRTRTWHSLASACKLVYEAILAERST